MKHISISIALFLTCFKAFCQCTPAKAACNTTYEDLRYAVAAVTYPGITGSFSGFLVNHTSNDGRLLFLTTHIPFMSSCGFDPGDLAATIGNATFTWNSDYSSCTGSASSTVTSTGATLLATSGFIALFELNNAPNLPELTYLGWDISTVNPTALACIYQHINTGVKKAILTAPGSELSFVNLNVNCNGTFNEASGFSNMDKIAEWDDAEPESLGRGAPLIMNNKKVAAVYITGNETDCEKGPSYFADLINASSTLMGYLRSGSQTNSATIRRAYCKASETLSGLLNASTPYKVSGSIVSNQNIANGLTVSYRAGTYVELNNGFVSGTNFVAEINPCSNTITVIAAKTDDETVKDGRGDDVADVADDWLKIYPNILPSGHSLTIQAYIDVNVAELQIFDLQGKHVATFQLTDLMKGSLTSIPLHAVAGVYLLKANDSSHSLLQKIIVR